MSKLGKQLRDKANQVQAKNRKATANDRIYKYVVKKATAAANRGLTRTFFYIYKEEYRQDDTIDATKKAIARLKKDGIVAKMQLLETTIDVSETGYSNYKMPIYSLGLEVSW